MKRAIFIFLLAFIITSGTIVLFFTPTTQEVSVSVELKDKTIQRPVKPVVQEPVVAPQSISEKEIEPEKETSVPFKAQIKKEDCAKLFEQKIAESIAYQPEISTTGIMVAPANIAPSEQGIVPANLPDAQNDALASVASDVSFPISLQLKKRYPYLESDLKSGDIPLVFISVKNGAVFVNDIPVEPDDLETLRQACQNVK